MHRAFLSLLAAVLLVGGCSSEDLATEVLVEAEFDGTACRITGSDPDYVATDDGTIDLLAAAPDASMTFIVTNTSDLRITGLVNRYDPTLSPQEAVSMERELEASGWTANEPGPFIVGPAFTDFAAEAHSIGDNQTQYHYLLQPGLSTTLVYGQYDNWGCDTSEEMRSLIEVPAAEPTGS